MSKIINDPIHGHLSLSLAAVSLIDTPQFQRLRDLKQLGTTYMLFPGASHNRFEHCVGVSHLAQKMVLGLKQRQDLDISERDVRIVSLAGLCHDLGHGPFSHAFEDWVRKYSPGWHHEAMSLSMLDYLIDDNAIEIERGDVNFIKDLIAGEATRTSNEKKFLFDIVANSRNSIDVDKFDYISRDCHNLGMKSAYDHSRLMMNCKVIRDQICFHAKEVYNIYEMFHTRYSLFKQVYTHRVGKAIEYMVQDAFTLADPVLRISERARTAEGFSTLSDSVLLEIERSRDEELQAARDVVRRIRKRKLYRMAADYLLPREKRKELEVITTEDIVAFADHGESLCTDDVILDRLTLNYALKNKNPLDNVLFYSNADSDDSFNIPKDRVSLLIPNEFDEHYLRVYCRDAQKCGVARAAFKRLLESRGVNDPLLL